MSPLPLMLDGESNQAIENDSSFADEFSLALTVGRRHILIPVPH